ncbi:hypothetical protein QQF64_024953, partial [Cirrhinus molitorella]
VHCVELTQTESIVLSPGQVLTLSCKISGYSVTDSSYCTHWIRQPAGKALEWVGRICGGGVHCVELTQTESIVLSPGQVLTLSCKISGYSVTDSSYCTHFIRQPAGKALEWVGAMCGS